MAVSKNNSLVVAATHINSAHDRFMTVNRKMGDPLIWEREARFALQVVENNKQLQECDMNTVRDSVINVATMGLSLNPATQHVALIPRWNRKKGMLDCTATPMYRGLVKLATDAGAIKSLQAGVIYDSDDWDMTLGSSPELTIKPNSLLAGESARTVDLKSLDRNKLIAAYCVATLSDGEKLIEVMGLEDVLKVANSSDSFNPKSNKSGKRRNPSGPWLTWPEEMAKKSVIRRAQKTWPAGANVYQEALENAINAMTEADVNDSGEVKPHGDVIDGEATLLISEEQAKELRDLCRQQGLPVKKVYETYAIGKMEEMSIDQFGEAKTKLVQRLAAYQEKHGNTEAA